MQELPDGFASEPFLVRDALAAGVRRHRLDRPDVLRAHHGTRLRGADTFLERCRALTPAMSPTQAFTGPTAARVMDLPLPSRFGREPSRLHVSSLRPQRAMRRPGVLGSGRGATLPVAVRGLPLLPAAEVWAALAPWLEAPDLVAVGDRLVSGTLVSPPLVTVSMLAGIAARSVAGAARLRAALPMIRVGAWSRPETLLRLLLVAAGLPEPQLNAPVLLGSRRVRPDLAWPRLRVAVEYDGRAHADRWSDDVRRHELFVDERWSVARIQASDLFGDPAVAVRRVAGRLIERGWRPTRPVDVTRLPRFEA